MVSRPLLRADQLRAGVEQQEVAGAVGVLGLAGREADLADRGRLLVAEGAGERHLARPAGRRRGRRPYAVGVATRAGSSGSIGAGDVEEAEQLVVPVERLEVHQHGAAGVGHVGDVDAAVGAAGEVPQQPASRWCRTARRRARPPRAPRRRSRGSTGSCRRRSTSPAAARPCCRMTSPRPSRVERRGDPVGAGVLPDDGVVVAAGRCCRSHTTVVSRWLVMPSAARSAAARPACAERRTRCTVWVRSQISIGLCSTQPACGRICSCSSWCLRHLVAVVVEDHEAGARRALVDRADEVRHAPTLPRRRRVGGVMMRLAERTPGALYPKPRFVRPTDVCRASGTRWCGQPGSGAATSPQSADDRLSRSGRCSSSAGEPALPAAAGGGGHRPAADGPGGRWRRGRARRTRGERRSHPCAGPHGTAAATRTAWTPVFASWS